MREQFQPLENRVMFSGGMVYSVTTTADSGAGSLRDAILQANVHAGTDTIEFHIGSGLRTISPLSDLPVVTDPVVIDATTQGGYTPGRPLIQLNGASVPATSAEIALDISAGNSTVKGLIFTNWGRGVYLQETLYLHDGGNNVIQGNWIGVDALFGGFAAPNGNGIVIYNSANNLIGGTTDGQRNVISGNIGVGVLIRNAPSTGNILEGNFIGTDVLGGGAVPNGTGVEILDASRNTVGFDYFFGARNVISGNRSYGVVIEELFGPAGGTTLNLVQGNFIGTDLTGMRALGNGRAGVLVANAAHDNTIGGLSSGMGNLISGNATGILLTDDPDGFGGSSPSHDTLVTGNYIGEDYSGGTLPNTGDGISILRSFHNTIGSTAGSRSFNLISGNGGAGVHIQGAVSIGNLLYNNRIGLDSSGNLDHGNRLDGVLIENAPSNTVGGTGLDQGNVISGNDRNGVFISSGADNVVQNNFIGLNNVGDSVGNTGSGVLVTAPTARIGGALDGMRNVISGNGLDGVHIDRGGDTALVLGNYIGTDRFGASARPNGGDGVYVNFARNVDIGGGGAGERNVISGNTADGVYLTTNNVLVAGNFIGTDLNGHTALPNRWSGVHIAGASNTVGGPVDQRNVISGNGYAGVYVTSGDLNTVYNNLIGTDVTGNADLGNAAWGIFVNGSSQNRIGGPGLGNVISGNDADGIFVVNGSDNLVQGNRIGLTLLSDVSLRNGGDGVLIGDTGGPAMRTLVGGAGPDDGNVIAYNSGRGVNVAVGTNNPVYGNSIYANGLLGIDLNDDGVTLNDVNDTDAGPNDLQNFPVITTAVVTPTNVVVKGSLNSAPGSYYIDVYANPIGDPSGHGEGKIYLGSTTVTVGPSMTGLWSQSFTTTIVHPGYVLSATATSAVNNTSEFSQNAVVADAIPPTVTLAAFPYLQGPVQRLNFQFSENVFASMTLDDFTITNLNTGAVVPLSGLGYNTLTNTAVPFLGGILPDGNYRATLHAAGITDAAGNPLDGNGDGAPGDDYSFDFFFLNGDANRDRTVGFADLVTLAQHYGTTDGDWSHGDFNYDGRIDFNDLVIQAQRYGTTLPAAASGVHSLAPTPSPVVSTSPSRDLLISPSFSAISKGTFSTKPIKAVLLDDVVAHRPVARRHK
jgi:parallel beta-helix repeat protein